MHRQPSFDCDAMLLGKASVSNIAKSLGQYLEVVCIRNPINALVPSFIANVFVTIFYRPDRRCVVFDISGPLISSRDISP
jgi:hypothetical protein